MLLNVFRRGVFVVAFGAILFSFPFFAGAASFRTPPSNLRVNPLGNSCVAEVAWDWAIDSSAGDQGPLDSIDFFLRRKNGLGGTAKLNESVMSTTAHVSSRVEGARTIYSYRYEDKDTGGGGLSPLDSYSYRVVAQSIDGHSFSFPMNDSEWVGPVRVLTSVLPPSAPIDLQAEWVGANPGERAANRAIDLRWKGNVLPDIGGFKIFRAIGNEDFGADPLFTGTLAEDGFDSDGGFWIYHDAGLAPAQSYRYKVQAFNKGVNCSAEGTKISPDSLVIPVVAVPLPPPAPDPILSATQNPSTGDWSFQAIWTYSYPQEHHFTIRTTYTFNADGVPQWPVPSTRIEGTDTPFSRDFSGQPSTKYAVQVCAYRDDVPGEPNLFACAAKNIETGVARPTNLRATPSDIIVNGENVSAIISLAWDDQSDIESAFSVEYKVGVGGAWQVGANDACTPGSDIVSCIHSYGGPLDTLYYRVIAISGASRSIPSDVVSVDLNKKSLKGWAWANAGGSQGNELGIGWISLSSQNREIAVPGVASYNVFLSGTEVGGWRELSGYAWSGIKCDPAEGRPEGFRCGYGWLSFEEADLKKGAGCPSGECVAKVNVRTGEVRGWAKFLAADPTKGAWTGWVSLRGSNYGVCLGDMNKPFDEGGFGEGCKGNPTVADQEATLAGDNVFSGFAWGDAVGGWIQFRGGAETGGEECDLATDSSCAITSCLIDDFSIGVPLGGISRNLGQTADFTASVSDNEICPAHTLTWSVVDPLDPNESPLPLSYGFVASPSSAFLANPNSARYTAPSALPSGKSLPFSVEVKVCVDGSTRCDRRSVEIRDLEPYVSASCADPDARRVGVSWGGMPTQPHSVDIFRSTESGGFDMSAPPIHSVNDSNSSGLWRDTVNLNTIYYYKARVQYDVGGNTIMKESREDPAECRLQTVAPENVQVFTQSDDTLWVNWKDNDTRAGRKFFVERVRLTPALLTYPGTMTDVNSALRPAISISDSEVQLQWDNTTNWTPYNHVIARVMNPTPGVLASFSNGRATPEILSDVTGVVLRGQDDGLLPFIPNPPNTAATKRFSYTDESLLEGTTYHYRIASCSQVPLGEGGASKYRTKTRAGVVGKPDVACGAFSPVVATTTQLRAPDILVAQALSSLRIRVTWNDNSGQEDGYEIFRDGIRVHTTAADVREWTDGVSPTPPLSSDTAYSYRVRAYQDITDIGRIYSNFSASRNATTHFVVTVTVNGGGTVISSPTGISCPGSCRGEFPAGTSVSFSTSASPTLRFDGWGGACSGTGACSVSGNKTITASFSTREVTLGAQALIRDDSAGVQGTVASDDGSITCSTQGVCTPAVAKYDPAVGSRVVLTATAEVGSEFFEWVVCEGEANNVLRTCTVIMNADKRAHASFKLAGGAFLPSLRDKLVASVFDLSGFVRKVAGPLFLRGATQTIRGSTSRMRSNLPVRGAVLRRGGVGVASLSEIFGGVFEQGRRALSSLFSLRISGAEVVPDYERFFETVAPSGLSEAAVKDQGLEPDTVYIYRVKSCVGGSTGNCTEWSLESAGKTLWDVANDITGEADRRPVCTRNSFCNHAPEFSKKESHPVIDPDTLEQLVGAESSQQQCVRNADCADVGRFEQSFQER